ncbi:MAG: 2-dehydropantoate 2-reductase [Firmicutes bacterium]|nr:2-dehydropantoate 2-reductase [Bacillota bacterium]
MRIGVMGAGAVGGYFGGLLAQSGEDVTFLARPGRADVLLRDGLIIKSIHGDLTLRPKVVTSVAELGEVDVLIVALKNYHLDQAWADIRAARARGAVILPLLNGVLHMDRFVEEFGAGYVLGGSCYIETTLSHLGHVIQTSEVRDIVYGPLPEGYAQNDALESTVKHLGDAFVRAQIPAFCREPILREMWKKYIFLCAFSGVTAATRVPIGEVLQHRASTTLFMGLVDELLAVATARKVDLSADKLRIAMLERARGIEPLMTSSMHRDLEKGQPLEVDSLQGAMVVMAEQAGVSVPFHQAICGVLAPHAVGRN